MNRQKTAYYWFMASVIMSIAALASAGLTGVLAVTNGPKSLVTWCAVGAMSCGSAAIIAALGTTSRTDDLFQHPKLQGRNQIVTSLTIFTVMIAGGISSVCSFIFLIPNRPN